MTTTYTFDQLKDDVRKEAEALRVHATKEELSKLDFENLDYSDKKRCIYGLMTGDCFSLRSAMLIDKCACTHFDLITESVDEISAFVMDKPSDFVDKRSCGSVFSSYTFSAIEQYICLPEAKNANLIAFLRGETETLEL
jgi:hypothetical protein